MFCSFAHEMGHLLGLGHGRGRGGSGKNGSAHGSVVQVGGKNNVAWYCVALYGIVWYCMHGIVCMLWFILNVKSPHYVQKGRSYTLMAYKEGHAEKRINYYSSPSGLQK